MSYSMIYVPKGRAREYAPLASNIYRGCGHQCRYCYAPSATIRKSHEAFGDAELRKGFVQAVTKDANKRQARKAAGRVLLCFTCDPYQPLDESLGSTRDTIRILHDTGHHVTILTKGGSRALRDLDLLGSDDAFATTLTFPASAVGHEQSKLWEPHAALPDDRIQAIERFHEAGVPTWVSLEPVLDPDAALECIRQTSGFVDLYKVGKLNADHRLAPPEAKDLASRIDWKAFGVSAIELLEQVGRPYYIKQDLAAYVPQEILDAPCRLTLQEVEDQYRPDPIQPSLL